MLFAANGSYADNRFKHLTIKDGLSSNRVYQSVQDKAGFIWICTDEGIDRFDGKNIVHYPLEMHNEFAGLGYQFTRILIDKYDEIFVISNRTFVYRLDRLADKFVRIKEFEPYYGKYVFTAYLDSRKNLMISEPENFFVYNYQAKKLIKLPKKISENRIYSITETDNHYILGSINQLYLLSYDFKSLKKIGTWNLPTDKQVEFKNLLYEKKNKGLWIGTKNYGIIYYDFKSNSYKENKFNDYLKEFPVWDIKKANDSTLLIGTDGAGLFAIDHKHKKIIKQYLYNQDDENTISSNVIHGILVSKNSLYFIATDIGGINILNPRKKDFISIKREKGNKNSLGNNVIHAIEEISPGVIAFGTDRGISLWYRKTNLWRHIESETQTGRNNVVTEIAKANDGTFWVGYFIKPTKVYNASKKYNYVPEEIQACKNSKAMFFDNNTNTLWVGKNGQKIRLLAYNYNTHTLSRLTLPGITTLTATDKYILAGTFSGLYLIDKKNHDFKLFNYLTGRLNKVTSIKVSKNDILWLGSDGGGLARIDLSTDSIFVYDTNKGLASNHIYSIEIDDSGIVWAVTEESLAKINPENKKIINYFKSDGIISGDFKYNASCKTASGDIIIGGINGATIFSPDKVRKPINTPNLLFTGFYINQNKLTPANSDILKQPLNQTKEIRLKYNQNSFSIHFTNIDFIHPEQSKYSWILEGEDKEWSQPSNTGVASYSNLPPGNYTFRVRVKPISYSESKPLEKVLHIKINLPFWKTPWAFVIYTFIILFFILLALYYNKLMHDVRSSREKLRYLANMAHEIKTPLSLIRAPIGDLMKQTDNESMQEKLRLAMNNVEKLQKRISLFLDFKRIDKIQNIHLERIEIIGFVKKKIFAFDILAKRNQIKLTFETALDTLDVYCDPDLLDRIISNLLSNAIKYNKPGGFVNVRIRLEEPYWILRVTDSGIGIPRKEQKKVFRPFFRASNALYLKKQGSGVGLALVADMVEVLKGTIKLESKENRGATFTVKLPIGKPDIHDINYMHKLEDENANESNEINQNKLFKILIAEDEQELRKYIKKEFEKKYAIIEAQDGQDALNKVQKELPDLVLTDVAMPRMNGRQLCMNIKSQTATSHIPVILLSALDSKDHILKGLAAGADDYITKPFDSSILIAKIENLINNRKKVKEKLINPEIGSLDNEIKSDLDKEFIKKIKELIEDNLSDPDLSVRTLYTYMGMSRTAFYHKLKSLIDLSPAEFIRLIKLNKAKELLLKGKYNINEVAYMCGFSDAKYFSTSFKKQFGKSPSNFIQEHQK